MSKLPCSFRSLAPLFWTRSYSRSAALRFRPKGLPDEGNLHYFTSPDKISILFCWMLDAQGIVGKHKQLNTKKKESAHFAEKMCE